MAITVQHDARPLVSVTGERVILLIDGVREIDTGTRVEFTPARAGELLAAGDEVWTLAPARGEVLILTLRESIVRLDSPAGRLGPTARDIELVLAGIEPALQGDDPDAVRPALATPEERTAPALPDAEVAALAMAQLTALNELLDSTLDLMTVESDMVCDATDLAIDQVQDMRIAWQEEGPEVVMSDVILHAIFITIVELSAAKIIGELLVRSHRAWSRRKLAAAITGARRQRQEALTVAERLRRLRQELQAKQHRASIAAQRELGTTPDLSKFPIQDRASALAEHVRAFQAGPHLERARNLAADLRRIDGMLGRLRKETDTTRQAMKKLSSDFARRSAGERFPSRELDALFKGPALDSAIPGVKTVAGKVARQIANDLPSTEHATPTKGAPVRPQGGAPAAQKTGDSPSTVMRLQALGLRRTQREEIERIRRDAREVVQGALERPEHGLPDALATLRETVLELALPELTHDEYMQAMRELAREIEFSIWSLVLPVFLDRRRAADFFRGGADVPGFDLYVRNASKRVIAYLSERFAGTYDAGDGPNDVARLVGALQQRSARIRDGQQSVMPAHAGRVEPLLEPTRLGMLKDYVLDEVEGDLDERQDSPADEGS